MDPIRLYDYLLASRAILFDRVRPLSDDAYRSEHPIGLGSIARTLHHVRAAEHQYMKRVRGFVAPLPSPAHAVDPEVDTASALSFAELEPAWVDQGRRVRTDLAAVTDWTTPMTCETTWDGAPLRYRASRGDFASQLVLHEVHHRAQVIHMLHRLDVEVGEIDFNALMWETPEPA